MKFTIAPSILSADFSNLSGELKKINAISDSWVHLDVMDGHFVPNLTFGPCVVKSIRNVSDIFFDVHLMVEYPENLIGAFYNSGANAITFHIESTHFPMRLIKITKEFGVKVGVALNPATPVEQIFPILEFLDIVLVMSVEPGFSGQKFIPFSIEKIQRIADFRKKHGLNFLISVDGGVNEETAENILLAGADVLVMGSYFFKNDYTRVVKFIEHLREK